ncbi:hypothetical protein C0995_005992 [Termitomyces sp. Mi166|nr:hypothetical protein C0995_005992 [Termitomyces sp. Mi166\
MTRNNWPAACLYAASLARLASKPGKVTKEMKEQYTWSWIERFGTGTERDAEPFFNIVDVLGYIFGNLFNLDPNSLSERRLRSRITTLPCAYNRLPLETPDGQDCRPNFFALHRSAFVAEAERDPIRTEEYQEKSSVLLTIGSLWPQLSEIYPRIFPSRCESNSRDPDHDEEELIGSLSLTPEGYDELLDDVCEGKYTKNKEDEDTDASPEEAESVAILSLRLKELLEALETNDIPNLSDSVSADIRKYDDATYLDLSTVCFPNVLITGEGKQSDYDIRHCPGDGLYAPTTTDPTLASLLFGTYDH